MPLKATFNRYFKESSGGEEHIYQLIPLHSCDYLKKTPIGINVPTNKGISLNEI